MPALLPSSDLIAATSWVVHDGRAGNRRQALALAEALQLPVVEHALVPGAAARLLSPRQLPLQRAPFGPEFEKAIDEQAPRLCIGCGRIAALATRRARAAGARVVQILDPRIHPRHWDLVIAPEHDRLRGANVLTLIGSLNPVDSAWLQAARQEFSALGQQRGPRTAVLIGGPTSATPVDPGALEALFRSLDASVAEDGGSLLICGSSRTPRAWATLVRERYRDGRHALWFDASDGLNPYAGVLAWADRIVATPDSVNMISEACSTSAPVFIAEPRCASGRVAAFLQSLVAIGRIRPYSGDLAPFPVTALAETQRIAAEVRARLSLG